MEAPLLSKSSSFTNISMSSITNGSSQNDEVAVSSEAELSDWLLQLRRIVPLLKLSQNQSKLVWKRNASITGKVTYRCQNCMMS